jgi:hypothetical protein
MNFRDAQLQRCYDTHLDEANDASEDLRRVSSLIATHDLFQMLEGPHSARVHETMEHLLSPAVRPGLRQWYRRPAAGSDSAAAQFRDQLSQLAGERLEAPVEISQHSS